METDIEEVDFLIVGAGPTGLGAAIRFEEKQVESWLLFEKTSKPGGLARTEMTAEGFYFDLGGHVIFSHYEYFDRVLETAVGSFSDPTSWVSHQRECYIRYRGVWVPYPFQNNLYCIPKEDQVECLLGLVDAKIRASANTVIIPPRDYDEWMVHTMGEGLAKIFLRPYNFKVWAVPPRLMNCHWLGERVSVVDCHRAIANTILGQRDAGWGPNALFKFPCKAGGTGLIWQQVAEKFLPLQKMVYGAELVKLDVVAKLATFDLGGAEGKRRVVRYEKLISTLPLDCLHQVSGQALDPPHDELEYSSTHVLGFGVRGENPHGSKCWLYFPEDNCAFYRATIFSNYSPNNVPSSQVMLPTLRRVNGEKSLVEEEGPQPGPYWSLMLEVSESEKFKPVNYSTLVSEVLLGCVSAGLLQEGDEIVSIFHHREKHGYPTPSLQRDSSLNRLLPHWKDRYQIWSRGRFGSWKYEVGNQDHSLILGVEAADSVLHAESEETTLMHANQVNGANKKNPLPRFLGVERFFVNGQAFPTRIAKLRGKKFASVEEYIQYIS